MSSLITGSHTGDYEEYGECVPPTENMELLYLIEFLVDTMLLKPENMGIEGMDPCLLQGQACIELNFLQYPPMSICESDVESDRLTGGNYIKFNAGKSLMFALSEEQMENPPPIYLNVSATKMLPHGSVPSKLYVGETKILLTELFKQVSEKVDAHPNKFPLSKSIKDKYILIGMKNKCPTAEVTIYIRLSCLGPNVVTDFQRARDDCDPYLFKNKESRKVYECVPKDIKEQHTDLCPPLPGWGQAGGKDCGNCGPNGHQGCDRDQGVRGNCGSNARQKCQKDQAVRDNCGPNGRQRDQGGRENCGPNGRQRDQGDRGGKCTTIASCGAVPDCEPTADEDEYEEFGTEVHGHALTIKVQRSQKSGAKAKGGGGNQITFQVPQSQNLCDKGKTNKALVYNVNAGGGNGTYEGNEPLQIVQGVDSPDKDIFVLRVGKKGESYAKGKLELELRTPKPKIEWPVQWPKKTDRGVQTEKEDSPKKGKGKGKGKGNGKKKK